MADSHLVFKNVCKHVANSQNKSITFMAKPFEDHPGSSCHIHLSIFDNEGQNIFKGDDIMIDEKTGLKSSYNLVYFLGGWMKHVLDVFPFYA
jgi:glutamine synthetase